MIFPLSTDGGLSADFAQDSTESMLINDTALQKLRFRDASEAFGLRVGMYPSDAGIVGICRDFHSESLQKAINPLAIRMIPGNFRLVSVQINPRNVKQIMSATEDFWKTNVPERPLNYSFLDETFNQQYAAEMKFGQVFSISTALAIAIACFGLLGLVMFSVKQKTKEIQIRRVVGNSIGQIVVVLSKEFVGLIALAGPIAIQVGYLAMNRWMSHFAYQTSLSAWIFLGSVAAALLVALLTINYQSIRAALANPAKSLRAEQSEETKQAITQAANQPTKQSGQDLAQRRRISDLGRKTGPLVGQFSFSDFY